MPPLSKQDKTRSMQRSFRQTLPMLCLLAWLIAPIHGMTQDVTLEELERRLEEQIEADKRREAAARAERRRREAAAAREREEAKLAEVRRAEAARLEEERRVQAERQAAEAELARQEALERQRLADEKQRREAEARAADAARAAEEAKKGSPETLRLNGGFYANGDGTLIDTQTNLVWTQSDSQTTDCANLGMRLPTQNEFRAIHDRPGAGRAACGGVASCKMSPLFRLSGKWVMATNPEGEPEVWSVHRNNGGTASFVFSLGMNIKTLCVRERTP